MEGGSWTCTNFILKEKGRYWKIFHTPFLCIWTCLSYLWWTSLVAQMVKHLPTMRETQVQSLGQEDPLKKEMATHSSILAWKIPWTEEAGRLQFMGSQRLGHDWATFFLSSLTYWASLVAQRVKHLPAMQETWVQSLGQEDPLEEEMATHSGTLAWKIPWSKKPGRL